MIFAENHSLTESNRGKAKERRMDGSWERGRPFSVQEMRVNWVIRAALKASCEIMMMRLLWVEWSYIWKEPHWYEREERDRKRLCVNVSNKDGGKGWILFFSVYIILFSISNIRDNICFCRGLPRDNTESSRIFPGGKMNWSIHRAGVCTANNTNMKLIYK